MIKMIKKLQNIYLAYYNLLIVQDLWQAHYQTLSAILLKEFIELNGNSYETYGNKYYVLQLFSWIRNFKDDLTEYKCLCCNKNYQHKFGEKLKEQFFNTYKFSNHDTINFILLLWKVVYRYKYMDDWEKFNETLLPEKEDLYSHLNMEDITDADYAPAKRVCKDTEIKNLGQYHDLYVQSNRLLLIDVFENFRNMCIKIYKLDPAKFLSAPG